LAAPAFAPFSAGKALAHPDDALDFQLDERLYAPPPKPPVPDSLPAPAKAGLVSRLLYLPRLGVAATGARIAARLRRSPSPVPAAPPLGVMPDQAPAKGKKPSSGGAVNPWSVGLGGQGILAVRGLQKSYRARTVVADAGLNVRNGEAVGLLGPNGAGKTTIFYMITGLVAADRGAITLDGHDITALPMYRRARLGIGYLPQEASIFRGLNVEDNIRAVLEEIEPDKARRERELDSLLDEFDIARLRKAPSIALSGGERRRCEIARALASRPSFVLLDEPFAGIDPIAVGDIQALVRQLTNRGIGVLITDHNVRETLGLVDRAYIIHSGRVLTEGSPDEIIANDEVRKVYLGEDFRL
jgi:lipopolysaccharide export system ATP-binding protein